MLDRKYIVRHLERLCMSERQDFARRRPVSTFFDNGLGLGCDINLASFKLPELDILVGGTCH